MPLVPALALGPAGSALKPNPQPIVSVTNPVLGSNPVVNILWKLTEPTNLRPP